jgi:hypothetical protein
LLQTYVLICELLLLQPDCCQFLLLLLLQLASKRLLQLFQLLHSSILSLAQHLLHCCQLCVVLLLCSCSLSFAFC